MARDDKVLTNRELTERLALLEARELKVKDLPITALRRELAKEPQNPAEVLLPHSIGPDMLAATTEKPVVELICNTTVGGISYTPPVAIPGLTYLIPVTGRYKTTLYMTCEAGAAGVLIVGWITPLGNSTEAAENIGAASNIRETISMAWSGEIKAGETVQGWAVTSSGSSGIVWGNHTKMFVERID